MKTLPRPALLASLAACLMPSPAPAQVETPLTLKDGVARVASSLTNRSPKDPKTSLRCQVFTVDLQAGKSYVIMMKADSLQGKSIQPYVRVDSPDGTEVGVAKGERHSFAQIACKCPKDGKYRIICASTLAFGQFNVSVKLSDTPLVQPAKGEPPLDPKLPPTFGAVKLNPGFRPDPYEKEVKAGGPVKTVVGDVEANYTKAPSFQLDYVRGRYVLTIYIVAEANASLLIRLPDGKWIARKTGRTGRASFRSPEPQSGRYDIYVGRQGTDTVPVTLRITEGVVK